MQCCKPVPQSVVYMWCNLPGNRHPSQGLLEEGRMAKRAGNKNTLHALFTLTKQYLTVSSSFVFTPSSLRLLDKFCYCQECIYLSPGQTNRSDQTKPNWWSKLSSKPNHWCKQLCHKQTIPNQRSGTCAQVADCLTLVMPHYPDAALIT